MYAWLWSYFTPNKTLTHLWVYKQLLGLAQMQLAPPTKMVDKSSL